MLHHLFNLQEPKHIVTVPIRVSPTPGMIPWPNGHRSWNAAVNTHKMKPWEWFWVWSRGDVADDEGDESSGTILFFRAQLTGVTPALFDHDTTAALGFAGVERLRDRALAVLKACETEALSSVWQNKEHWHYVRNDKVLFQDIFHIFVLKILLCVKLLLTHLVKNNRACNRSYCMQLLERENEWIACHSAESGNMLVQLQKVPLLEKVMQLLWLQKIFK